MTRPVRRGGFTFTVCLAGVAGQEQEEHESSHLPTVTITITDTAGLIASHNTTEGDTVMLVT